MKIKHWQGYGSVSAKKVNETIYHLYGHKMKKLVVEVEGNHEWGLVPQYKHIVFDWLVKRFDKKVVNERQLESYDYVEGYNYNKGNRVDACTYYFHIDLGRE